MLESVEWDEECIITDLEEAGMERLTHMQFVLRCQQVFAKVKTTGLSAKFLTKIFPLMSYLHIN